MVIHNQIFHSNCMDILKQVPDKTVDLVVTDCPYKVVAGGRVGPQTPMGGIFSTHHEGFKNGGVFDDNMITFAEWLPEIYRVLKDGTHCYIMINGRNLCELQNEAERAGFRFQNLLVWDKGNKTPNRYYMQQLEFILLLSKAPARNINDMGCGNLFSVPNPIGQKLHPTEKPVGLMKQFILNSSNVGDLVLDPFMGAGGVIIASLVTDRVYFGVDSDKQYVDITNGRIIAQRKKSNLW